VLEILFAVVTAAAVGKIARNDNQSGVLWGGLTLLACIGAFAAIPLPYLRVLLAGVLGFVGMIVFKIVANR
jgi:hypothetical protein